jgi:hypothetical protein
MPEIEVPMSVPDLSQVRQQQEPKLPDNTCWEVAYFSTGHSIVRVVLRADAGDTLKLANWGGFLLHKADKNETFTIPVTNLAWIKQFVKEVK